MMLPSLSSLGLLVISLTLSSPVNAVAKVACPSGTSVFGCCPPPITKNFLSFSGGPGFPSNMDPSTQADAGTVETQWGCVTNTFWDPTTEFGYFADSAAQCTTACNTWGFSSSSFVNFWNSITCTCHNGFSCYLKEGCGYRKLNFNSNLLS